jgi:hypothetical protein
VTSAPFRPSPYFVSRPFDFLFVGGLSIATCLAFALTLGRAPSDAANRGAQLLMWVVNWPHFSATLYRLFRRRDSAGQYPLTAYGIPWLVTAGAFASLAWPAVAAPWFVKLFLIWSPYHFSGQSVGVSLVYARRAGVPITGWPRRALTAFIFGTYATATLAAETSVAGGSYYGVPYPGLGVPAWVPTLATVVMYAGAAAFVCHAVAWSVRERRLFPGMVFLPGLAQYVWFISGSGIPAFYVFVPLFHSLQYLPIAWAVQMGERVAETGGRADHAFLTRETAWWMAANLAGGAGLFWVIPRTVAAFGVSDSLANGVAIAAVQIHHFFVDGVIWKLRQPHVRNPLVVNVLDYVAVAPAAGARQPA